MDYFHPCAVWDKWKSFETYLSTICWEEAGSFGWAFGLTSVISCICQLCITVRKRLTQLPRKREEVYLSHDSGESTLRSGHQRGLWWGWYFISKNKTATPWIRAELETRITQPHVRACLQWSKDCCQATPLEAFSIVQCFHHGYHSAQVNLWRKLSPQTTYSLGVPIITHLAKGMSNFFRTTHATHMSTENMTIQDGREICHHLKWKLLGLTWDWGFNL